MYARHIRLVKYRFRYIQVRILYGESLAIYKKKNSCTVWTVQCTLERVCTSWCTHNIYTLPKYATSFEIFHIYVRIDIVDGLTR